MSAVVIDLNDVAPGHAQPARFDLDLIVQRLRETAETWVPRLFPNGKRVGDEWRLANIRGDAPRKTGSCVIALRGPHAGDWIDFDGNAGGGPISTIEEATGLSGRELIVEAADMAGVHPGAPARQAPSTKPSPRRDASAEIAHILSGAVHIAGTPAETYLAGRALTLSADCDLLFHRDLTHWETRTGYPALLGQVRDSSGEVIGLHRTYLVEDGGQVRKAPVAKPKMMLGRIAGGAVRLGPLGDGDRLALSEGVETGLAVMTSCPGLPVWATLSTSGLEQVDLPAAARRVLILADNDTSGAGLRAAEAAARRLRAQGRDVAVAVPPEEGQDFNDLLLGEGPEAVERVIGAAQSVVETETVMQIGQHRPVNYRGSGEAVPTLRADEGDLARSVERVWSLLMASNSTPWVFRFAGQPTWVVPDDEGRPVAAEITEERLRHMLARLAHWKKLNARGELVAAPPPVAVVKSVLATPDPALPVLVGIVNTPVFGRAGTLLTTPGYHPDARLLYAPTPGFSVPTIPDRPTPAEIAAARSVLCEDLLGDFPFVGPAEMAHVIALVLLGFLRGMIDGPTPLHLIEKPSPGSGATLMVDAVATILTGSGASVMTEGRDDDEWRKRVTAKLRQIPAIVLIDNLRAKLDSSAVAAALTAPFWEDRILGASEMARLPIRCLWIATGNNPEFSNEMARRLVRIRLDPHVERPWQRTGFRHPDLMVWVRANRARLVAACLTLCQAWIAAGKPHNIWIPADDTAPDKLATFAAWANREGAAVYVIPGTVAEQGQARAADVLQMQAIVVDLDAGDIPAKLDHVVRHLGAPTLIIESGGRTPEGAAKLHAWWQLSEPAVGEDLATLCRLRGEIAVKVGGDTHFRSAHQPIRAPGTVYHKHGQQRLVQIREHRAVEVELGDFAEKVAQMPALAGVGFAGNPAASAPKPGIEAVLTTPVREGAVDDWSRFQGASAAIGHFVRMVHEGRLDPDEGWEAICGYNAAMLRPSWPLDRLQAEADRLWALHVKRNGPPLMRAARADAPDGLLPTFTLGALLDDTSAMPDDIIAPRVLTPGGLLVLGGAPKVGKSDFLISWLVHMAAGVSFLGFAPPRALRVFYCQAEIQYHYLRERMQQITLPAGVIAAARDTFVATPKLKLLLDAQGVARVTEAIGAAFPDAPPDIIVIDPIRNLFDGGPEGGGENDNSAMMFFLKDRVEPLREAVNPDAGVILAHHTRKASKQQVKDDPFLALSGASALRGFYTTGLLMHRPDEDSSVRRLEIELRNGPALPGKLIDKVKGEWIELNPLNERLVRKEVGARLDAERLRKHDAILAILLDEASDGRLYTSTQLGEAFENQHGLGSKYTIRERVAVLATKGFVKFRRDLAECGYPATRSHFGYLCVEDMRLGRDPVIDADTGEVITEGKAVLPTHWKCPHSGRAREVENPSVWVYPEGIKE